GSTDPTANGRSTCSEPAPHARESDPGSAPRAARIRHPANIALTWPVKSRSSSSRTLPVSQPQTEISTRAHGDDARVTEELMLVVLNGKARGTKVKLKPRFTIGKSKDNDLVLPDDTVSRHHCELSRVPSGVLVKDLGSTNHTRVGQ